MGERHTGDLAIGLLMGAVLGATAAVLFAPRSGRETREQLSEEGRRLHTRVSDTVAEYERRGRDAYAKTRATLGSTAEGLKDAGRILVQPNRDEGTGVSEAPSG